MSGYAWLLIIGKMYASMVIQKNRAGQTWIRHMNPLRRIDTTTKPKWGGGGGGRLKKTYEILNLRAPTILLLYKHRIFQCKGKIFCVEFHTKYLAHTLKDVYFIEVWKFKSSCFLNTPPPPPPKKAKNLQPHSYHPNPQGNMYWCM